MYLLRKKEILKIKDNYLKINVFIQKEKKFKKNKIFREDIHKNISPC